jgi:hypothetical protein
LYQPTNFNTALSARQAAALANATLQRQTAEELRARVTRASGEARRYPDEDMWVASVREAGVVAYADGWLAGSGAERGYRTDCFVHPA